MINYIALPGLVKEFSLPLNHNRKTDIIIEAVCKYFKVDRALLCHTKGRKQDVVDRKQLCAYLLREDAAMTWLSIATLFNKDHTTAIHYYNKVAGMLKVDSGGYREAIAAIRSHYT